MIHSLLDNMLPDASDEEEDERREPCFKLRTGEVADAPPTEAKRDVASAMAWLEKKNLASAGPRPEACSALVICGPGAGTAYALSCFQLKPMPWVFEVVKDTLESPLPPPPRSPKFFVVDGAGAAALAAPVAVAFLEAPVAPEMAAAWTEALLAAFSAAKEVLLLDRIFRAGWFVCGGAERPQEPHLCGLWTSSWGPEGPLPQQGQRLSALPSPNSVEGLGAALLTECEVTQRKCLVALALQDGAHLGEGSLHSFSGLTPLFRRLALLPEGEKKPNYAEGLKQVVSPLSMSIYA